MARQQGESARARSVERRDRARSVERKQRVATPKSEASRAAQSKRGVESKQRAESKQRLESKRAESKERAETKANAKREARDAQRAAREAKREAKGEKASGGRLQVSDQHRVRLRDEIRRRHAGRNRLHFAHGIGRHVPRHFRLWAFPAAYLAFAPEYSDYRYVIVDDDICVVDPATYEIVAVIDEGPGLAPSQQRVAGLSLTTDEREFIFANARREGAQADIRIRLALGAEVPPGVALVPFSDEIVSTVPKVEQYSYVVVGEDVVIVDPRTRSVALVIAG